MGNNNFLKNAIKNIEDEIIEGSEENKALINFRPGANISAMLEVISALSNKPVNRILFEELRCELFYFIIHHSEREDIIMSSVKTIVDNKKDENGFYRTCNLGIFPFFDNGSILQEMHTLKYLRIGAAPEKRAEIKREIRVKRIG